MIRLSTASGATSRPRAGVTIAAAGLSLLLASCVNLQHPNAITPGGYELPRCAVRGEVPLEQLDQPALHDCNAEGVTIRLPDNWGEFQVQSIGVSSATSRSDRSGKFGMVNWGVEGVGVTFQNGDERQTWGTSEAARRRQSAVTP